MDKALSIENQILLCCARRAFDPDVEAATGSLEVLVQQGVDWNSLFSAARLHNLLPLVYERLGMLETGMVPAAVTARLRSAYCTNLLRNQRLHAELVEVIKSLRREGVEAIVLKGGALAWTVYANAAQRPMADLDLLVQRGQMDHSGAVLRSLGFRLPDSLPAHMVPFEQRFGSGLHWLRSHGAKMINLDMKHHLIKSEWCRTSFSIEPDVLWAAARPLALDGTEAWQLSAEDTLICLCLHLALNHSYAWSLGAYVDMDRVVVASDRDLSWSRLVERAGRFGVKTIVYLGLRGAQRLLETPVPFRVMVALRPGGLRLGVLRKLAPLDAEAVMQGAEGQLRGVQQVLLYAALTDHVGAVGSMARDLLFPSEEWLGTRYALGTSCSHRLAHPWRIARAALRSLYRPLFESSLD
jgi:hypothetical protein